MDDDCLIKDLTQNFDSKLIENYLHELIDFWLKTRRLRYNKYVKLLAIEDWWKLEDVFKRISRNYVNNHLDSQLDKLDDEKKNQILRILSIRKLDLVEFFKHETNNLMNNYLNDFDWAVKHSISSSKLAKLNETICTLKLYTNECKSSVECELNKNELDKLIEELEKIDKIMNTF